MKYREKMKRLKNIVYEGNFSDRSISFVKKCASDVRAGEYAGKVLKHIEEYSAMEDRLSELLEQESISESDMDVIKKAAASMYAVDREDAASVLVKAKDETARTLLFGLAEDGWNIVRCSAYDSLGLGSFQDDRTYEYLLCRLDKENDALARSYIAENLADMYKNSGIGNRQELVGIFTKRYDRAKGTEKTAVSRLLVLLGEEQYISGIFEEFENKEPHVRVWALSAAEDIADKSNFEEISERVKKAFADERTPFVKEKLDIFYKTMEKIRTGSDI